MIVVVAKGLESIRCSMALIYCHGINHVGKNGVFWRR